jgi:hypothetical protein
MKINEVVTVVTEKPQDKSKVTNRLAALDKDGDKVLWKDVLKDPGKSHAEIEVDGRDYKIYIDGNDNTMYVFDASRGVFVKADQNFVRRATGQNTSARFKAALMKIPGMQTAKNLITKRFDPDDMEAPGSAQVAKSTNWLGQRGARVGGYIDNYLAKRKNQKTAQNNWINVYGVNPPKPNDTILWLTADGKKASGKLISELGSDMDGDGVPELSIKMASGGTVAIKSTSVISINGIPLQKQNMGKPQRQQSNDPADTGLNAPLNDPANTGQRNQNTSDPAAI